MSKNQNQESGTAPVKKRHSLWWLWLLLILAAFAGGIILGLKLNTLPLPNEVKDKLYPVLESYMPGATTPRTPEPAPAVTPQPSEMPAATPTPEIAPFPTAEMLPVEATPVPVIEASPTPVIEALPEPTAEVMPEPAGMREMIPAVEETPAPEEKIEENLAVSETAAFESAAPAAAKYIGIDSALEIALNHAELKKNEVEVSGVYRTKDEDGTAVYEVSFLVGEVSHDYVINAVDGEILSWKLSGLSFSDTVAFAADFQGNDRTESEAAVAHEMIGEERAREIAYGHAGVKETDILRSNVKLDGAGENASYHVEFRITDRRFDYSIDAYTGEILTFELR